MIYDSKSCYNCKKPLSVYDRKYLLAFQAGLQDLFDLDKMYNSNTKFFCSYDCLCKQQEVDNLEKEKTDN